MKSKLLASRLANQNESDFPGSRSDNWIGSNFAGAPAPQNAAGPGGGPQNLPAINVWINEIHYDNSGADTLEGVEIAGTAGTDLTGWSIVPYNGSGGASYTPAGSLSGTIPNQQNGFGTVYVAIAGLQNGAPDGLALVDGTGTVIQFLSYEGAFTATNGAANGMTSTDIGVSQGGTQTDAFTLQLQGTGDEYTDFTWAAGVAATRGGINTGQSFVGAPGLPNLSIDDVTMAEGDAGTVTFTFTVSLSAPAGPGGVTFDIATADGTAQDDNPGTEDNDYVADLADRPDDPSGQLDLFLPRHGQRRQRARAERDLLRQRHQRHRRDRHRRPGPGHDHQRRRRRHDQRRRRHASPRAMPAPPPAPSPSPAPAARAARSASTMSITLPGGVGGADGSDVSGPLTGTVTFARRRDQRRRSRSRQRRRHARAQRDLHRRPLQRRPAAPRSATASAPARSPTTMSPPVASIGDASGRRGR